MADRRIDGGGYHLSLTIGKALWDDLVRAALPIKVREGGFDLGRAVHAGIRQLGVKERVAALIEDRGAPEVVQRARERAAELWRERRLDIYRAVDRLLHVEGTWRVEIDRDGTEFRYAPQKFGIDAHVKTIVKGTARLLDGNVEIPFEIERRLGASLALGDIRYDRELEAVVGDITDAAVDFGEHVVLRLLNEALGALAETQLRRFSPVPILRKEQVESLFAPAGGALRVQLGVEDVVIEVNDEDLTLRVRFGFTQKQIEGGATA